MSASTIPRVFTLLIPDWPAVALARGNDPIVVLDRGRVVAATPTARELGVRHGDRRRAAVRSCPAATVLQRDPLAEVRAFEPVIEAVVGVTPRIEVDRPGELRFDMRGPTRRLGGENGVVDAIAAVLLDLPHIPPSLIGVADGPTVATIAALGAIDRPVIVPAGGSVDFLRPLPLSHLSRVGVLSDATVDLFERLGVRCIGDLAALGAGEVLTRFGPEGARAHHVATGGGDRLLAAVEPASLPEVERRFDDPLITVTPAVFSVREMAEELAASLSRSGLACTSIVLSAETEHSESTERHWYRADGFSASAIVDRARWQLDSWTRGGTGITAGIVLVRLQVVGVRADVGRQEAFWGGLTAADDSAARAVARLVAICGEDAVRVPVPFGGRLPGERCVWVPATTVDLDDRSSIEPAPVWPGGIAHPAPTTVPVGDEPVEVFANDGTALSVSGRGEVSDDPATVIVRGRRHRVVAWAGPWPLLDRWWDPRHRRRLARLQVVLDDGTAHLLAVERHRWSLIGSHD